MITISNFQAKLKVASITAQYGLLTVFDNGMWPEAILLYPLFDLMCQMPAAEHT